MSSAGSGFYPQARSDRYRTERGIPRTGKGFMRIAVLLPTVRNVRTGRDTSRFSEGQLNDEVAVELSFRGRAKHLLRSVSMLLPNDIQTISG